jgi:hypothetical protein
MLTVACFSHSHGERRNEPGARAELRFPGTIVPVNRAQAASPDHRPADETWDVRAVAISSR